MHLHEPQLQSQGSPWKPEASCCPGDPACTNQGSPCQSKPASGSNTAPPTLKHRAPPLAADLEVRRRRSRDPPLLSVHLHGNNHPKQEEASLFFRGGDLCHPWCWTIRLTCQTALRLAGNLSEQVPCRCLIDEERHHQTLVHAGTWSEAPHPSGLCGNHQP